METCCMAGHLMMGLQGLLYGHILKNCSNLLVVEATEVNPYAAIKRSERWIKNV